MPMSADGLAKLMEECGELVQVAAKKLAYFTTDEHPDGGPPLSVRLSNEMSDVFASITFVIDTLKLDSQAIEQRAKTKLALFQHWHAQKDNNGHSFDAPREGWVIVHPSGRLEVDYFHAHHMPWEDWMPAYRPGCTLKRMRLVGVEAETEAEADDGAG